MRNILSLAFLIATAACAGPLEQHLVSTGPGVREGAIFMWAGTGDENVPVGAAQLAARTALAEALAGRGYAVQEDAPLVLDVGLSERQASVAVQDGSGSAVSLSKSGRLLQNCKDRILRMTVYVADRTTGAERFAGSAQEAHCHASFAEVLPRLSSALAQRMAAPAGSELRFVSGKD
jgi:hypothetical protein